MKLRSFNQGATPIVAFVNHANTPLGIDLDVLVKASQKFLDTRFVPIWGTPAKLIAAKKVPAGAWGMLFFDDADEANSLGYHDLTKDGLPYSKVFVKESLKDGEHISVTVSHELCEMLIDPAAQMWAQDTKTGTLYAYETSDAVEGGTFLVDGVPMQNFVFPAFFESFHKPGSVKLDYLGRLKRPFQTERDGYQITQRGGKITEVFGSVSKRKAFSREDRRGHRSGARVGKK